MREPLIEKLCQRWKMRFPEAAIRTAIYSTFPELRTLEPPVDVNRLARKRGVVSVRTIKMPVDGTISLVKGGGYTIELNRAHSMNRRRFTCGHEIGHTFFFELDDEINVRSRLRIEDSDLEALGSNKAEEYLCNFAASEILMPYGPFSAKLRVLGPTSKSVLTLSRLFKTSLWSTARRVIQLSHFKLVIALWEYQPSFECYQTKWVVRSSGNRQSRQLYIDKTIPIFKTLQSGAAFRGRKLVSIGGPIADYFVDGIALQDSEPRLILTVFILEEFAHNLLGSDQNHEVDAGQLHLF